MKRRLVLLFVFTTFVLVAFSPVATATFIPGPNGKIVFTSGRANSDEPAPANGVDDNARLWVADWPGGVPVQVTKAAKGVQHRHPNWSPDHTRIVYASGPPFAGPFALRILDLRTGSDTQFAPAAAAQDRPSWSPDGSQIAYGSVGDLWVKGVAPGSEPIQITNTGGITEERPVWSPDGNTLYYNRGPVGNRDLYKKSPVTLAGAETSVTSSADDDWQPALSPDGGTLCFLRGPMAAAADIHLVGVNGGLVTPFSEFAEGNINCVWSPDGSQILFTRGVFSAGDLAAREADGTILSVPGSWGVANHFDGNADWATNFSPTCQDKSASVGVNAFVAITLSCTDPDSGFGAAPPTPDPLGDNSMEIVSGPKNGAIGGLDNGKVIYTPNKDFKGTDSFTYRGEDNESKSQPATVTIQITGPTTVAVVPDKTAPSISGLSVSSKRWRAGKRLASISKAPLGTRISFRLSEAAAATLSFQRAVKKGGKTRYVNAGSLKPLPAKAGLNKVRFQGRLSGSRSLAPGRYRVLAGARDAAGNQSAKRIGPSFTIVNE